MYNVSQKYKEQTKKPIRNQSYMRIFLGIINQEAQMSAQVENQGQYTLYSDFSTLFTKNDIGNMYATYEQNFWKADGSMYFLPISPTNYRKNGITTENFFSGNPLIQFSFGYGASDIRGLTIQFGYNYPTKFSVITDDETEIEFENNSDYFETSQIFENTSTITLKIKEMSVPNNRIRIFYIKFGLGVEYGNEEIIESESMSTISRINEELPEVNFSVTLKNENQRFNVDNPSSEINFLEPGQNMSVMYGYELDDGSIEWMQLHTLFVNEWSADDSQAKLSSVDRFKYMSGTYYKGQYYENGISLYDLAKAVLSDAGEESEYYYLDSYLKTITVKNPLPNVTHKEALQIIANAGRCIMDYDRYGRIRIYHAFIPDYTTTSNGTEEYSNAENINDNTKKDHYAGYSQNFWTADGTMLFLPKDNSNAKNAGYVSAQISGSDGIFKENPVITRTLEAKYKCFGIGIKFFENLPKKFLIKTYADGESCETITIQDNIAHDFWYYYEFEEFDKIELEFVETQVPNNRILIDYISFGDETDYTVGYDDLYSTPNGIQLDKVKNLNVTRSIYTKSGVLEDVTNDDIESNGEDLIYYFDNPYYGYMVEISETNAGEGVEILESGTYYIRIRITGVQAGNTAHIIIRAYKYNVSTYVETQTVNNRGTDIEWSNPLISDVKHCKDVCEWVADYLSSGIEYELDYRGDPAIDCGDTIYQENKYADELKTIVEEHQILFNGSISGAMRTIRKSFRAKQDDDIETGDDYPNLYNGSYVSGYLYLMDVVGSQIVSVLDYPVDEYRTTDYIEIAGINYLYSIVMNISTRERKYYAYSYLFYSSNSSSGFIGTIQKISSETSPVGVEVPEGAKYVRITQPKTNNMGDNWENVLYIGGSSNPSNDIFVTMSKEID